MLEIIASLSTMEALFGTLALLASSALLELGKMVYFTRIRALKTTPGPWFPAASSLWIRWQRWHGRLSFRVDDLLARYGPIVRISPRMVLVNDPAAVQAVFARQNLAG